MNWRTICVFVACAAALPAQTPPVTILEIDIENGVVYVDDVNDRSKIATSAAAQTVSTAAEYRVFKANLSLGDIVAVNGKPMKGTWTMSFPRVLAATTLSPGRPIADLAGACPGVLNWVFVYPDGSPMGTISAVGMNSGVPAPGAPTTATRNMFAVVGGTGPFLGARGQAAYISWTNARYASMLEDPANRRIHGGGTYRHILHLIPMTWPEVLTVPTGRAIFHGDDFSPVTAEKPARAGEQLMMSVSGLGPVKPNLDPGQPFPPLAEGKVYAVNSPVEVTVNGKAAQVVNAIGWPEMNNVYRVDFRVPEGTAAGTATLGLSVAWINGPEVKIPVR
jgi:hypothetical protein